ncbi:ferritin heavy chain [Chironomus tepperi]|uniref:ferritin heavy chain n=1 Tax=Chironomus tepperi TaxID=113505 RepID=UPI00391F2D75
MNKFGILAALICVFASVSADTCDVSSKEHFNNIEFVDMKKGCVQLTEDQIQKEITASLKYLSYGAYFSQDNVNRPGYAKFFFDAASEEREHAHKLIEYLQMRGRYFDIQETVISNINIGQLVKESEKATALGLDHGWMKSPEPRSNGLSAGMEALRTALKMEYAVTQSIRNLISACEAEKVDGKANEVYNDYHFVDYLTGDFLTEQYQGKRDIAGKISTLGKMIKENGAELADYLFDKKLQ